MARKLVVEFIGTFILVFVAVGTAVFGFEAASTVGIALAFGLVLMAMAYAFGGISGCHVNPAVTIGMVAARRQNPVEGAQYLLAQFAGGIVAAGTLQFLVDRLSRDAVLGLGPKGIKTADVLGSNSTDAIGAARQARATAAGRAIRSASSRARFWAAMTAWRWPAASPAASSGRRTTPAAEAMIPSGSWATRSA